MNGVPSAVTRQSFHKKRTVRAPFLLEFFRTAVGAFPFLLRLKVSLYTGMIPVALPILRLALQQRPHQFGHRRIEWSVPRAKIIVLYCYNREEFIKSCFLLRIVTRTIRSYRAHAERLNSHYALRILEE